MTSSNSTQISAPMVRVVVINFDGGQMTIDCLHSILATDWPTDRLEIVLVDNGSLDDVVERVRLELPQVRVLEPLANTGFARGCNLGITASGGYDYVALVNNDARVSPSWLAPLVEALASDEAVGAACPKLLFDDHFVGVEVKVDAAMPVASDPRSLGVCVTGARLGDQDVSTALSFDEGFFPAEPPSTAYGEVIRRWSARRGAIRLPVGVAGSCTEELGLRLSAPSPRTVRIVAGDTVADHVVTEQPRWIRVATTSRPFDVINNAGSALYPGGFGGDRGFLEPDDGRFDEPCDVFAWCGGAVLLQPRYLADVGLFDERLFLYYEDTDLSWRGQLAAWRFRYVPNSTVRHRHAASSVAGSDTFRFYTERNRIVVLMKNAPSAMAARAAAGTLIRLAAVVRRDLVTPLMHVRRPRRAEFRRQWRVVRGWLALTPHALAARRRATTKVRRAAVLGWTVEKDIAR